MPENTPLHISEALRRGLATINLYDQDGKRLPTAYIMSQLTPAFFYDQLKEFAQRQSAHDDEKETQNIPIDLVRAGDTVVHHGILKTVCANNITRGGGMGTRLWGDSYCLGQRPVTLVTRLGLRRLK